MTTHEEVFESYRQTIIDDIWIVDECYEAIFFISDHYKEFGAAPFLKLFGRLQNSYFIDAMILAVGRLFDRRKDVRSVSRMIMDCEQFSLMNKREFISQLRKLKVPNDAVDMVEREGLSARVAEKFHNLSPAKKSFPELERVVNRRHESVAHRTSRPKRLQQPFFSDIKVCNDVAKSWITCFALGIQNFDMRDSSGVFRFSSDAKASSRQMKLLLQFLHLLPAINEHHTKMIKEFHRKNIRRLVHQKTD